MASKQHETASFVVRFTQKIFEDNEGKSQVQWRGNIRHVQGGDEKRFSEFTDVVDFIQEKLTSLAVEGLDEKSPEERKSLLSKSFELWKQVAIDQPKKIIETIKDPKKQLSEFQDRVQLINENINSKLNELKDYKVELSDLRSASKTDFKTIMDRLDSLASNLDQISRKVDSLTGDSE